METFPICSVIVVSSVRYSVEYVLLLPSTTVTYGIAVTVRTAVVVVTSDGNVRRVESIAPNRQPVQEGGAPVIGGLLASEGV